MPVPLDPLRFVAGAAGVLAERGCTFVGLGELRLSLFELRGKQLGLLGRVGDLVLGLDDRLLVLLDHALRPFGVVGQFAQAALDALGLTHDTSELAPGRRELLA